MIHRCITNEGYALLDTASGLVYTLALATPNGASGMIKTLSVRSLHSCDPCEIWVEGIEAAKLWRALVATTAPLAEAYYRYDELDPLSQARIPDLYNAETVDEDHYRQFAYLLRNDGVPLARKPIVQLLPPLEPPPPAKPAIDGSPPILPKGAHPCIK